MATGNVPAKLVVFFMRTNCVFFTQKCPRFNTYNLGYKSWFCEYAWYI